MLSSPLLQDLLLSEGATDAPQERGLTEDVGTVSVIARQRVGKLGDHGHSLLDGNAIDGVTGLIYLQGDGTLVFTHRETGEVSREQPFPRDDGMVCEPHCRETIRYTQGRRLHGVGWVVD